jgi:uncharacterized protein (DUF2345 family)
MPTAAEVISQVRTSRAAAEAARSGKAIPEDGRNGAIVVESHTVTAGEDTAGSAVISTQLEKITDVIVQILDASNVVVTGDVVVTVSGGDVTVADGSTKAVAATDVITIFARGF